MWADVDTEVDFLNYSEVAEIVADIVRDARMRPVSVGVFGSWGSGKSTLLNLIEYRLNPEMASVDFVVVRFDAWLYQGLDDARAALMEVIATSLLEAAKGNEGLIDKGKRLLARANKIRMLGLVAEGGALAMGLPTFGLLSRGFESAAELLSGKGDENDVKAVESAGKNALDRGKQLLKPEAQQTPPREIAAFRREFADVLKDLNRTLVVFVDNLDRCLPKQTIQTLEALRLFLFMGQTAFVVAADEEMVRHSVADFFNTTASGLTSLGRLS